ncbi:MAG: BTB/POZ domain-containing protein [Propionibacteriaceae bacterium]
MSIFQDLFALLEEKHPVIVLKDVSIKFLLLILEYVYLGKVEIETEDVQGFIEVAKTLQIKAEFEDLPEEEEEDEMMKDLLTEMTDQDMQSNVSKELLESMECSQSPTEMTKKPTPGRKLMDEETAHKKGPPRKKPKTSGSGVSPKLKPRLSDPVSKPCIHCENLIREKDRKYHQKFCWENPDRIVSDCQHCDKKYQIPGKLRVHMKLHHPEIKF